MNDIIIGLTIFAGHGGTYCWAEHDIIGAWQKEGESLSGDEIKTLYDAGWFRSEAEGGGCECEGIDTNDEGEETGHEPACRAWIHYV